jgi:hypothetical protein
VPSAGVYRPAGRAYRGTDWPGSVPSKHKLYSWLPPRSRGWQARLALLSSSTVSVWVLLASFFIGSADAHDDHQWVADAELHDPVTGQWCCGKKDCYVVEDAAVVYVGKGYCIRERGESDFEFIEEPPRYRYRLTAVSTAVSSTARLTMGSTPDASLCRRNSGRRRYPARVGEAQRPAPRTLADERGIVPARPRRTADE